MSDTSTTVQLSLGKAKVNEDLRVLAADVQELMRLTAAASGEGLQELRARLGAQVQTLRDGASGVQASAGGSCRSAMVCADAYVKDKPWQAVGMGVAAGLVLGALLS